MRRNKSFLAYICILCWKSIFVFGTLLQYMFHIIFKSVLNAYIEFFRSINTYCFKLLKCKLAGSITDTSVVRAISTAKHHIVRRIRTCDPGGRKTCSRQRDDRHEKIFLYTLFPVTFPPFFNVENASVILSALSFPSAGHASWWKFVRRV